MPAGGKDAKPLRRSDVKGVRYYIIDFGISSYFKDPVAPRLVTGPDGLDNEVPELHREAPYDPFPVDIFILGNMYKKLFVEVGTLGACFREMG